MTWPIHLPPVVTARELGSGGSPGSALRAPALQRVRRGVHTLAGADVEHPDLRIAAVAAQLPAHAVVGGWAAARLHEAAAGRDELVVFDGSRRWDPRMPSGTARVLVCAAQESRLARREDVQIFRSPVGDAEREVIAGIPVSTALRTTFDLARLLPFRAAVVGVDRMLNLGLVAHDELAGLVITRRRARGRPTAFRVAEAADAGAESPQESMLRLTWVDSLLPRPLTNRDVVDLQGRFLGRVDLIDDDAGVVAEYDGGHHEDPALRRADASRQQRLERAGLVVVRADRGDVGSDDARAAWQGRLRVAYRTARRRPPSARGWQVRAVTESTFERPWDPAASVRASAMIASWRSGQEASAVEVDVGE